MQKKVKTISFVVTRSLNQFQFSAVLLQFIIGQAKTHSQFPKLNVKFNNNSLHRKNAAIVVKLFPLFIPFLRAQTDRNWDSNRDKKMKYDRSYWL